MRLLRLAATLFVAASCSSCSSGELVVGTIDGTDPNGSGSCSIPSPTRHYTFDGVGTDIVDTRGGASGRALGGATLDGSGSLHLDGVDDYVDLPNGVFDGFSEVTVALWVRAPRGAAYLRLFDFGTTSAGEDPAPGSAYVGRSYLAATPASGTDPSGLAAFAGADGAVDEVRAASAAVLDAEVHAVVVVLSRDALSVYFDGARVARSPSTLALATIVADNVWLGRSQYGADPYLSGDYADLRVFGAALTDCQIAALYMQGASPP